MYIYMKPLPFLLPTCDFTNHSYHLATKHWKLNSMTVQRSTSFPGQTPKIIYAWIHCAFQNLFTCSKGINIPPPLPPTPLPIQNNTDLQMLYTWQHKMMLKKKHKVHFSCLWVYTEQMLRRSENRWSLDPESKLKFWHGMLSADAITKIKFLMGHLTGFKVSCSSKHEAKDERLLLGFSINKKLNYWLSGVRWLSINDKNSMKKKKDNMKGTSKVNRLSLNMYITV